MAVLETYRDDFKFLSEIKKFAIRQLENSNRDQLENKKSKPLFDHTSDGKKIRLVFPQGPENLKSFLNEGILYFVGFLGCRRSKETLDPEINERVWKADSILIEELSGHPNIIAYVSGERVLGGDWGNLVLFKSETAISEWRSSTVHSTAVKDLSPRYYTYVRIHGGQLAQGLMADFDVDRTIFLDYTDENNTKRVLKSWKEQQFD